MFSNFGISGLLIISLTYLLPLAFVVFIIIFVIKFNRRGKENLELQKQQVLENNLLKDELISLKNRVTELETILKSVE